MPQDPYGFPDAAPAGAGAGTAGGDGVDPAAMTSMWSGVISTVCAAAGPCLCYAPYLAALPLGVYAIYTGVQTRKVASDDASRSLGMAGIVSGAFGAGISALFLLAVMAYVAFLILMVVVGAAGDL